ncbi:MAG: RimK family alpha-L-glutamate ligase [Coriobacteriia bacterium]|nr:RimK family alpha-L-glutamate ligase [Coriobacteriia bacterium]
MSAPVVAVLTEDKTSYSKGRFEHEAPALGMSMRFLHPQHFDLLVDSKAPRTYYRNRPLQMPAAFVARTGSETTPFARAIIKQMEATAGVEVINTHDSIVRARDKLLAHQLLAEAGIPFPRTVLARQPSDVSKMVRLVGGPPVILKLISGTHGKGVMLGRDLESIESTLETVWALNETLLIQEFVAEAAGTDIRVIVVGGKALGAMRRRAKLGHFRANVHQGAAVEEYPMDERMEWLALRATEVMGLDISGVDLVEGPDGYSVIEVNSGPGFEGFEKATGINVAAEMLRYTAFRIGL